MVKETYSSWNISDFPLNHDLYDCWKTNMIVLELGTYHYYREFFKTCIYYGRKLLGPNLIRLPISLPAFIPHLGTCQAQRGALISSSWRSLDLPGLNIVKPVGWWAKKEPAGSLVFFFSKDSVVRNTWQIDPVHLRCYNSLYIMYCQTYV